METIVDQRGRRLALSRSGEIAIIDAEGRERATHKLPYGAQIMHKDGEKVKKGDRIAEWDPFTMPLITEKPGVVKYQDLVDAKTLRSEEHTSELQSLMRISYAVFCLKKKNTKRNK